MWLANLSAGLTTPGFELDTSQWYIWVFKILLVVSSGLYLGFAFLVVRQVQLMSRTVKTDFAIVLFIVSLIHLALAFLLFLYMLAL